MGVVSLGVGLYGNEEVSAGSRSLLISVRQLGHRVLAARTKIETSPLEAKNREDANTYINSLIDKLDGSVAHAIVGDGPMGHPRDGVVSEKFPTDLTLTIDLSKEISASLYYRCLLWGGRGGRGG